MKIQYKAEDKYKEEILLLKMEEVVKVVELLFINKQKTILNINKTI